MLTKKGEMDFEWKGILLAIEIANYAPWNVEDQIHKKQHVMCLRQSSSFRSTGTWKQEQLMMAAEWHLLLVLKTDAHAL